MPGGRRGAPATASKNANLLLRGSLRARPETAKAVLVAVTGYGQEQDRNNAVSAGFDHHFVKPVGTSELASLLSKIAQL
jgi:CheY-like chemotaxis protein